MSESQIQLKKTFKLLTFDFVNSAQKMASLSGERLHYSRQTLFTKIINLLSCHQGEQAFEDYSKMLENSQDEGMKYECFEKDLSVSVNDSSEPKDLQSDLESEIQESRKDSFDDSTDKIKRENISNQRFAQETKYTGISNEIFQYVDSFDDECKREEEYTPIDKLNFALQISQSFQDQEKVKKQEEDEDECIQDDEDEELQEQGETPIDQDDSSFTPVEECEDNPEEEQNKIGNKPSCKTKSASNYKNNKKTYRSYSENLKKQAIQYASEMGFEFSSRALQIPKKNITRWMRKQDDNSGLRGRKPGDPAMEQNLTSWIKFNIGHGQYVTQTEIRKKAREFAGSKEFKASKGWLQKYFRRNRMIGQALNSLLYLKRVANTID